MGIREKSKNQLNKYITEYVDEFCKKHELEFDFWVADLIGTVGAFGDYFFSFEDIRLDLETNQPENNIFDWYDHALEMGMKDENAIHYYRWIKNRVVKKENQLKKITNDVKYQLNEVEYDGDLGDVGNEIGIAISKHIVDDKMGFELVDFIHGIKHGVDLNDKKHCKK